MQNYELKLLPAAWAELEKIAYIHLQLVGPNSAQNITDKILNSLRLLQENPYMGSIPKYRFLQEKDFRVLISGNYLCFYRVENNTIKVYHIADGRKDYTRLF